jgi:hypothetical protein
VPRSFASGWAASPVVAIVSAGLLRSVLGYERVLWRPTSRSRGARLAKEHKDSPRRIDAAVCMVIAVHRAAELADTTPAIYA